MYIKHSFNDFWCTYINSIIIRFVLKKTNNMPLKTKILPHIKQISSLKYIFISFSKKIDARIYISTSKPQKIYFSCQFKWLNIFLVMSFSYREINLTRKSNLFKHFMWKIFLIQLEIVKIPIKWHYNVEILFKTR